MAFLIKTNQYSCGVYVVCTIKQHDLGTLLNAYGTLNASASDAKGHLARLEKMQGAHDKTLTCDDLG